MCAQLEARGDLERLRVDHSAQIIPHVRHLVGGWIPDELEAFYREHVRSIVQFAAEAPVWNDRVGWRTEDRWMTRLLHVEAVPILNDGCGNLFGLDLSSKERTPAVYFFDCTYGFDYPRWAAGSSLARFLLLAADQDRSHREGWPEDWWLGNDPDIINCPRAPAPWLTEEAKRCGAAARAFPLHTRLAID